MSPGSEDSAEKSCTTGTCSHRHVLQVESFSAQKLENEMLKFEPTTKETSCVIKIKFSKLFLLVFSRLLSNLDRTNRPLYRAANGVHLKFGFRVPAKRIHQFVGACLISDDRVRRLHADKSGPF